MLSLLIMIWGLILGPDMQGSASKTVFFSGI